KTRSDETASHGYAVSKHVFDAQLVEYPGGIVITLLLCNALFCGQEFANMSGLTIVVFVSIQLLPSLQKPRDVGPSLRGRIGGFQRIAGECVEVVILLASCHDPRNMGMIVDRSDLSHFDHNLRVRGNLGCNRKTGEQPDEKPS